MERPHREMKVYSHTPLHGIISWILYHLIMALQWIVYPTLFSIRVIGRHNLNQVTNGIIVSNHCHLLDPGFASYAIWPKRVYFTGMEETFRIPVFSWFIRTLGGMPIPRRHPGRIVRPIGTILSCNAFVQIFPEGELDQGSQRVRPFLTGFSSLANFFEVPVIPITEVIVSRKFLPARVTLVIGEPIDMRRFHTQGVSRSTANKLATEYVRDLIQQTILLYSGKNAVTIRS